MEAEISEALKERQRMALKDFAALPIKERDYRRWDPQDWGTFAEVIGFPDYSLTFSQNLCSWVQVHRLRQQHLCQMGIGDFEHQKAIMRNLRQLMVGEHKVQKDIEGLGTALAKSMKEYVNEKTLKNRAIQDSSTGDEEEEEEEEAGNRGEDETPTSEGASPYPARNPQPGDTEDNALQVTEDLDEQGATLGPADEVGEDPGATALDTAALPAESSSDPLEKTEGGETAKGEEEGGKETPTTAEKEKGEKGEARNDVPSPEFKTAEDLLEEEEEEKNPIEEDEHAKKKGEEAVETEGEADPAAREAAEGEDKEDEETEEVETKEAPAKNNESAESKAEGDVATQKESVGSEAEPAAEGGGAVTPESRNKKEGGEEGKGKEEGQAAEEPTGPREQKPLEEDSGSNPNPDTETAAGVSPFPNDHSRETGETRAGGEEKGETATEAPPDRH
uniref:SAM domain-containing protein n=1 Tax=Chromera velia CCMP2878 TaxID=1169474 RepID=A0A0G4FLQ8_9ALVE|mmetsp:Transcript_35202/g.69456  ORF Transcript_35202/g.69456 Transcript_35202/m.69456 type:complete len:448 (-) Transcript_35202:101-1444(-)|eukprot:Cvel_3495.t1-p1 / transcript=Cvel_3495.t1 / gene=Cvel_3495 / organism=Chromera_velia_CCMP2878 / gene_product=hypothetical protein / transcript_product=hypothetical protein / location=Cvel_scaffold141:66242-68329(-) / protein_length=447 / sequence_SO=supercontig / SO=protein_coding / is_pseudo=false